jgi:hypothetical protein
VAAGWVYEPTETEAFPAEELQPRPPSLVAMWRRYPEPAVAQFVQHPEHQITAKALAHVVLDDEESLATTSYIDEGRQGVLAVMKHVNTHSAIERVIIEGQACSVIDDRFDMRARSTNDIDRYDF